MPLTRPIVRVLAGLALALAAVVAAAGEAPTCQRPASGPMRYLHADASLAIALLGPPPDEGSTEARSELAAVLAAQRAARGTPRRALAIADSLGSCSRLGDALGAPAVLADAAAGSDAAVALAFLDRAALQASAFTGAAKRRFLRARPYVVDAHVERLADVSPDQPLPAGAAPGYFAERDHTGYPSGHGALGAACAILMAELVPERSAQLYARGRQFGESRIVIGAHRPRDIEAGRTAAAVAVALMQGDACFQEDQASARRALRAALGLEVVPAPAPTAPSGG
jgi:acid phosphatase (class A)